MTFLAGFRKSPFKEDCSEDMFYRPADRSDVTWCIVILRDIQRKDADIYGKWLVFKDLDKLSETWKSIVEAMKEDRMERCCEAKCSTLYYNPHCTGPGPCTVGVICVYTYKDDMDAVGFKLIQLVKQDIKYKTDEDTLNYRYAHMGKISTIKTLYYNQGNPSFELVGERCFGTTKDKEDTWHVNKVENPNTSEMGLEYGKWVLFLNYYELTSIWHMLKRKILCGKMRALKMVCPPKRKHYPQSQVDRRPQFHVHTTEEQMKEVGGILISVVRRTIKFEKVNGYPSSITLFWNRGEFSYEKVTRKGITKNWRTGEDMD